VSRSIRPTARQRNRSAPAYGGNPAARAACPVIAPARPTAAGIVPLRAIARLRPIAPLLLRWAYSGGSRNMPVIAPARVRRCGIVRSFPGGSHSGGGGSSRGGGSSHSGPPVVYCGTQNSEYACGPAGGVGRGFRAAKACPPKGTLGSTRVRFWGGLRLRLSV